MLRYVYASGILDGTFAAGVQPNVMDNCPGLNGLSRTSYEGLPQSCSSQA